MTWKVAFPDASSDCVDKAEFVRRFVDYVVSNAGFETFDDGVPVRPYAEETAVTYFENPDQRADGPEACAEEEMSYWGEE